MTYEIRIRRTRRLEQQAREEAMQRLYWMACFVSVFGMLLLAKISG